MLETIVDILKDVPWYWVLIIGFLMTMTENLFPPVPGDSIIVFTGAMASFGNVNVYQLILTVTLGSVVGFVIMFLLGKKFDKVLLDSNKFKFISRKAVNKVEGWFKQYGYWLIVINRFIAGTRAVISFFAGMANLSIKLTILLSAISALIWNSVLIYFGYQFGNNWKLLDKYLDIYGKTVIPIVAGIILFFVIRYLIRMRLKKS